MQHTQHTRALRGQPVGASSGGGARAGQERRKQKTGRVRAHAQYGTLVNGHGSGRAREPFCVYRTGAGTETPTRGKHYHTHPHTFTHHMPNQKVYTLLLLLPSTKTQTKTIGTQTHRVRPRVHSPHRIAQSLCCRCETLRFPAAMRFGRIFHRIPPKPEEPVQPAVRTQNECHYVFGCLSDRVCFAAQAPSRHRPTRAG